MIENPPSLLFPRAAAHRAEQRDSTCVPPCAEQHRASPCVSAQHEAHTARPGTSGCDSWPLEVNKHQASYSASPPGTPSTASGVVQRVGMAAATLTALPVNTGSKSSWSTGGQGCDSDQTSEIGLRRGF